jgi:hypothetical protein
VIPHRIDRCDNCGSVLIQRTPEQNDAFHALMQDISEQLEWPKGSGIKRDIRTWKQLLSAAYERTKDRHAEVLPAIDGHGIDVVYWHSSRRGKRDMSQFLDFVSAFAVEENVQLSAPEAWGEWA